MILERYCYSEIHTLGRLTAGDEQFHTIERPWIAGMPGGVSRKSCVPDGRYFLLQHKRPNGDQVLALRNPDLGVYYEQDEVPADGGRYMILFHVGNYVDDVVGCIAPGLTSTIASSRQMVTSSRVAMQRIMALEPDDLIIRPALGTS